jgi:hypothetical protein
MPTYDDAAVTYDAALVTYDGLGEPPESQRGISGIVQRPTLPRITWTVDGNPVDLENDWRCNVVANGGFDLMTGTIKEAAARARMWQIAQGAPIIGYQSANKVLWAGRLATDPLLERGRARLVARGGMVRGLKTSGRRLYQTRDYSQWQDGGDEPFEFDIITDNVESEVRKSQLFFRGFSDEDYASGDSHPLALWAKGALITRYAFDLVKSGNTDDFVIRMQRFTGPIGARTQTEELSLQSGGPTGSDHTISTPEDGLVCRMTNVSGNAPTKNKKVRIKQLRVNGIAPGDTFRDDEVITDLGKALGYDVSGVRTGTLNVLPFDLTDGSWAESGLSYMAMLTDRCWLVLEDRGLSEGHALTGERLIYAPWEEEVELRLAKETRAQLTPLELFNKVVVKYTTVGDTDQEYTALATPNPLAMFGYDNVYELRLTDPQADDVLAGQVATTLSERYSKKRYAGVLEATTYDVLPGSLAVLADFGPGKSVSLRIQEVEFSARGARVGVETPVSPDRLIALAALEAARG